MSGNYHNMCKANVGKCVHITEHCGRRHYGRIVDVDDRHVYLTDSRGGSGFSYGWGGGWGGYGGYGGWGYGGGRVWPVALGAIGGFALASAFFW
ncbi:hypothetical protein [Shouchella shacheensis]|uniref:hypothetical protein n=1 Tax=Shouchella shacheensis TaxID=1649580 RepID=UPI0007400811|nr:hypothetical protein [Shouchella shacheensis]